MILLLDNYDSFSFILKDYLQQCHEDVVVRENNDDFNNIINLNFSRVVLSPGPKDPAHSGCLLRMVEHCANQSIPTLGVCLGHQAIGQYFGGTLEKAIRPMHGKVSSISHAQHPLFENIPSPFNVCRYHSLVIKNIENTSLQTLATSDEGEIMSLAHQSLPLWGVQFHPESVLTSNGIPIIKNWLSSCR